MYYRYLLLWLAISLMPQSATALPYYPQQDNEVLEKLPAQGETWLEIRALRLQVAAHPEDMPTTLNLVKRYIELGRAESDPRYYGYAEAALAPWLKNAQPNAEVLTLSATLFQNRHEFPAALQQLNAALALQPRLAQAWLTRALILEVQGQYAAAVNNCKPLLKLAVPLTAKVCINAALSLSGQLDHAYQQLQLALPLAENAPLAEKRWLLVTLAELAERKGDSAAAEHYYQQALQLPQRNGYLLATYADFLLDQQRYTEVSQLLANDTRADGLLLRLALAEQALQAPQLAEHITALTARFAASRMRGDSVHQGDEARFLLHILKTPQPALALALSNWAVQHEPRDARILLEAALATAQPALAAAPALEFLATAGVEDVRLQTLIKQCQGGA